MNQYYRQGFVSRCAEYGVDPDKVLKIAQATAQPQQGGLFGGINNYLSGNPTAGLQEGTEVRTNASTPAPQMRRMQNGGAGSDDMHAADRNRQNLINESGNLASGKKVPSNSAGTAPAYGLGTAPIGIGRPRQDRGGYTSGLMDAGYTRASSIEPKPKSTVNWN